MTIQPRKPFKKKLKDTLEGIGGFLAALGIIATIALFAFGEPTAAIGVATLFGIPAIIFIWLSTLIKPRRIGGVWEGEDWRL